MISSVAVVPALLFLGVWAAALSSYRLTVRARYFRVGGLLASCIGLIYVVLNSVVTDQPVGVVNQELAHENLAPVHLLIAALSFLAVPRRVLERPEAHWIFFVHAILLVLIGTTSLSIFLAGFMTAGALLAFFIVREARRHTVDPHRFERMNLYVVYRFFPLLGLVMLAVSVGDNIGDLRSFAALESMSLSLLGKWGLVITLTSSLGLFPLHSWLPSLMAAPRLNFFVPLFALELGLILFFRIFIPAHGALDGIAEVLVWTAAIGLVYASLLLFGESRLKRIVGYLIMSHVSLMVLALASGEHDGLIGARIDGVNVFLAASGLLMSMSFLTSRFGVRGVTTPSGIAGVYPEIGICVLVCTLSLVGFPGTVGFVSEELFFKGSIEYQIGLLPVLVFSLALNGYSTFRLFARVFFGSASFIVTPELALRPRERFALLALVALLLVNGLAPNLLFAWGK